MFSKAKLGLSLATFALILIVVPGVNADPIRITTSTSGFELLGMGSNGRGTVNPNFDALFGRAHSDSNVVDSMGGSFTAVINPLLFTPGFTGFGSAGTYEFNFSQLLTVNGQTQTLNVLAALTVTSIQDSVRVTGLAPLIFQFDTFSVVATVLPVTISSSHRIHKSSAPEMGAQQQKGRTTWVRPCYFRGARARQQGPSYGTISSPINCCPEITNSAGGNSIS